MGKVKDSATRLDAAEKAAKKAGGKIHAWYLTWEAQFSEMKQSYFESRLLELTSQSTHGAVNTRSNFARNSGLACASPWLFTAFGFERRSESDLCFRLVARPQEFEPPDKGDLR